MDIFLIRTFITSILVSFSMILLQNERVGCEQCIRGHRAADCLHLHKYLISIKGRGRPAARDLSVRFRINPDPATVDLTYEPIESKNGRGKSGTLKLCHHLDPNTEVDLYEVKLGKGFRVIGPAPPQATFKIRKPQETAQSVEVISSPIRRQNILTSARKHQLKMLRFNQQQFQMSQHDAITPRNLPFLNQQQVHKDASSSSSAISSERIFTLQDQTPDTSFSPSTPASTQGLTGNHPAGKQDEVNGGLIFEQYLPDLQFTEDASVSISSTASAGPSTANASALNLQTLPQFNNHNSMQQQLQSDDFVLNEMNFLNNSGDISSGFNVNHEANPFREYATNQITGESSKFPGLNINNEALNGVSGIPNLQAFNDLNETNPLYNDIIMQQYFEINEGLQLEGTDFVKGVIRRTPYQNNDKT